MGEFVDVVVEVVVGVGFYPCPFDWEPGGELVDFGPEVGVGFAFPALGEGLDQEIGIAVEVDSGFMKFLGG